MRLTILCLKAREQCNIRSAQEGQPPPTETPPLLAARTAFTALSNPSALARASIRVTPPVRTATTRPAVADERMITWSPAPDRTSFTETKPADSVLSSAVHASSASSGFPSAADDATCSKSWFEADSLELEILFKVAATDAFISCLSATGSDPVATHFIPNRNMERARIAVVAAPSPVACFVHTHASLTRRAPRSSNRSSGRTSLATVRPPLVMAGSPLQPSTTMLRPRCPSVTPTASASRLISRRSACRATSP